jgi:hypothetical protein
MIDRSLGRAIVAAVLLAGCADTPYTLDPAPRVTAAETADLLGVPVRSLDSQMARRGFRNVGSHRTDAGFVTNWWNAGTGQCFSTATREGRVVEVGPVGSSSCRR